MPMAGRDRLHRVTSVEDLRSLAERSVPRAFFQYADHGSYEQSTLQANRHDFEAIGLRRRVGIDVDDRSLQTTIMGESVELPLAVAPIGLYGMMRGDGEILVCRAAQRAGIPFCLSTMSICSIEDVAASVDQPFWFQLYLMRDRGFVRELIERALAANCSALFPTLDLPILGERYCDVKNGMTVPPEITLANILDVVTKPAWATSVLTDKRKTFGNIAGRIKGMDDVTSLAQWMARQFDPTLTWRDIECVRSIWPGKLVLEGILDPEDAKIAAGLGVSATVVSNHGGRQLDGAPSSISALPDVPSPAAFIAGITSREQRKLPSAFTCHDASNCSAVMCSTSANTPVAALNKRVPTSPISAVIATKQLLTDASLPTSQA
jgi:L-lactate dehydrogenase (cytochrome)